MNTEQFQIQTNISHFAHVAFALLHFVKSHPDFAKQFATLIKYSIDPTETSGHIDMPGHASPALIPRTEEEAMQRASWLLTRIARNTKEHVLCSTLNAWANGIVSEDPEAFIILGVKVGVLPVGVIGEMKVRRDPMPVLLRSDVALQRNAYQTTIVRLTHGVVEKGLIVANGNTRYLDPELGDWLFGREKRLSFYSANLHTLRSIINELERIHVPFNVERDEKGPLGVAMSPIVYVDGLDSGHDLHPLVA